MTKEEAIKILQCRDGYGALSGYSGGYAEAIEAAIEALKAESVKYGHWIGIDDFPYKTWECNRCGKIIVIDEPPNYCENCGAKMSEVKA